MPTKHASVFELFTWIVFVTGGFKRKSSRAQFFYSSHLK